MIEVRARLAPDELAAVRAVVDAAVEADGGYPLSEHVFLHLTHGGDVGDENLLLYAEDELAGYAHLDGTDAVEGPSGELVVHPAHRGRGVGTALVEAMLDRTREGRPLRLWAHGTHPAAEALAARLGFQRSRVLFQMRRSLFAPLPAPTLPDDVTVRTFVVGSDEQRWVRVNNRAFAEHPDQGRWTVADVRVREAEPWFDPAGFFLAERGGELVAFHWTKVHGDDGHGHGGIGEVYVVGVDPSAQGQGLGPAMTLVGLRHLRSRGLPQAMLYVDESNGNAVKVYERLGFTRWATDVLYRR